MGEQRGTVYWLFTDFEKVYDSKKKSLYDILINLFYQIFSEII